MVPAALQVCALPSTTSDFSTAGNQDSLSCAASRHTIVQREHIPSALGTRYQVPSPGAKPAFRFRFRNHWKGVSGVGVAPDSPCLGGGDFKLVVEETDLEFSCVPMNSAGDKGMMFSSRQNESLFPMLDCFHVTGRISTKEQFNSILLGGRESYILTPSPPGYLP